MGGDVPLHHMRSEGITCITLTRCTKSNLQRCTGHCKEGRTHDWNVKLRNVRFADQDRESRLDIYSDSSSHVTLIQSMIWGRDAHFLII